MGKNQQHKMRQMSRKGGGGGDGEGGASADGMMDASFHSAEWHQARLAALTSERMTWDDYKQKQKEDKLREEQLAGYHAQREHRAQLDADRAARMGGRSAGSSGKDKKHKKSSKKKHKKDKEKTKRSSKDKKKKHKKDKKKRRRSSSGSSSSSSSDSDSNSGSSSSDDSDSRPAKKAAGPVKLSEFLKGD